MWGGAFQAAVGAHDAPGYGTVLGAFHSEVGLLNRGRLSKVCPGEQRVTADC